MASGQLGDLQELVRANVGNRDDKNSLITKWLNQTVLEVAQRHGWPELESVDVITTTADVQYTAAPSDMMRPVALSLQDGSNSRFLIAVTWEDYNKQWPRPQEDATGRPAYYAWWQKVFYWYRIPDDAYSVNVWNVHVPTDFDNSDSTSTTQLTHKDELLVAGATYRALRSLQQYTDAAYWRRTFYELLAESIADASERRDAVFQLGVYEARQRVFGDYWKYPTFGK